MRRRTRGYFARTARFVIARAGATRNSSESPTRDPSSVSRATCPDASTRRWCGRRSDPPRRRPRRRRRWRSLEDCGRRTVSSGRSRRGSRNPRGAEGDGGGDRRHRRRRGRANVSWANDAERGDGEHARRERGRGGRRRRVRAKTSRRTRARNQRRRRRGRRPPPRPADAANPIAKNSDAMSQT